MLSNVESKVTSVLRRNCSFATVLESVINLSAAIVKEHAVFFLAAGMVDIVENVVLYDFMTGNYPQTYYCYLCITKSLPSRSPTITLTWKLLIVGR